MKILNHSTAVALLLVGPIAFSALPPREANASGLFNHAHKAQVAIDMVQDQGLREILSEWPQLFKFAAMFPDAVSSAGGTVHTPEFLTAYATAIQTECFSGPIDRFCRHRPEIECKVLGGQCNVGGRACTTDLSTCRFGHPRDCPGLLNLCTLKGVCTGSTFGDYVTPCAKGGNQCPGLLNICVANYGVCVSPASGRCDRLITHFMGALAHLVTDINADKFFARSVHEREDCPSVLLSAAQNPPVLSTDPQFYTDQEMDAYLAYTPTEGGGGEALRSFLPGPRARVQVEDNFLDYVLFESKDPAGKTGLVNYAPGDVTGLLNKYLIAMEAKVVNGKRFDGWECEQQPSYAECDDPDKTFCKLCNDSASQCQVGECAGLDDNGAPKTCTTNADCPGSLGGECVTDFGGCPTLPEYRVPNAEACPWAIDDDHWHNQGGGTLDDANEIATLMDQSWRLLQEGGELKYRMVGRFADRHLCVGEVGSDCLSEKTLQVIGSEEPGESEPLDGQLSDWSVRTKVEGIGVSQGTGLLGFSVKEALTPVGVPAQVECEPGPLDLDLDEEPAETRRLTDTLFTAFIEDRAVQVRTELTRCSAGGRFLVKNIRIDGEGG